MLIINSLRELGIPGRFISIFHEGVDFCDFLFACTPDPFQKVWRLFCRYLFLVYPPFGALGELCFRDYGIPDFLYLYFGSLRTIVWWSSSHHIGNQGGLRRMDVAGSCFLPLRIRGAIFVTSGFLSCTPKPFWKVVYSKIKWFAPSQFFLFIVEHLPPANSFLQVLYTTFRRGQNHFDRGSSTNFDNVSLCKVFSFPLIMSWNNILFFALVFSLFLSKAVKWWVSEMIWWK